MTRKRTSCTPDEVRIRKSLEMEDQKYEKVQKSDEKICSVEVETYSVEVRVEMPILKKQEEKRLVTGIILEPETVDGQGDVVSAEVIERAAHNFLSGYNRETQMGILHKMFGKIGVELVESWIAPSEMKFGNEEVKEGTWLMTCRVLDDSLWKKIKSGEITGFSIGGSALVVAVRNS